MGANYSGLSSLKSNEYISRLVSNESISGNDPFWNQLLSFKNSFRLKKENSKLLDESISLQCQQFHQNNLKTGNYGTLIKVLCKLATETIEMSDNPLMISQTTNAIFLVRCFTKYIIEIENESALIEQINSHQIEHTYKDEEPVTWNDVSLSPSEHRPVLKKALLKSDESVTLSTNDDSEQGISNENISHNKHDSKTLYLLINTLFKVSTSIPIEQETYYLHLEVLNTFIALLSVQMFTKLDTRESFIYETIMVKMEQFVSDFIKTLLTNIIQQMPAPEFGSTQLPNDRSLISSVTSGLWTMMTLGYSSPASDGPPYTKNSEIITYLPDLRSDSHSKSNSGKEMFIECSDRLLAWQSCHILLILSNHCTNETLYNPYRLALFHFTDSQDTPTNMPDSDDTLPWFSLDYSKLFQMFTYTLHTDQYTLLLYMLLHRNQHFKMFILSRLNIDLLIIPIMKVVYTAPERNSHHIYMALIILLILSEDNLFNKTIHNIPVKNLLWYTERSLFEISLGGLLILVIIRTIQFNITRMRDKYLHTNCLAALANMSSKFQNLHPYVCQRINSLFNLLAKKRTKLIGLLNSEFNSNEYKSKKEGSELNQEQLNEVDIVQDLSIIEELMRMVLEIINSCLTNHLNHNSNLIYSVLYNKNLYIQFRSHPTFQDVIQNIDTIITSFSHEIDNSDDKSIESIKRLIEIGTNKLSKDGFKKFPELKFKYVEEDQPEEFFVPYVWSLIYKFSNLYWIDHSIKLYLSDGSTTQQTETK